MPETSIAARAQHVELRLAEVVADRADHAHLVEERRGQREMHGGAAEHPLARAERRLDCIKGDGSDDGDGHCAAEGYPARDVRAILMREFGGPEVLELAEAPIPQRRPTGRC